MIMARIVGSAMRSRSFAEPVAGAAMLRRAFWRWLRHCRIGAPAGPDRSWSIRPGRARLAQDLDERLLDDIGAPCWLREQARLRKKALPRSASELTRL